jgi:hypothetical protein
MLARTGLVHDRQSAIRLFASARDDEAHSVPTTTGCLTGIRFLAAILVVFYHYWANFIPQVPPPRLVAEGAMGVSLFYVLSGSFSALFTRVARTLKLISRDSMLPALRG